MWTSVGCWDRLCRQRSQWLEQWVMCAELSAMSFQVTVVWCRLPSLYFNNYNEYSMNSTVEILKYHCNKKKPFNLKTLEQDWMEAQGQMETASALPAQSRLVSLHEHVSIRRAEECWPFGVTKSPAAVAENGSEKVREVEDMDKKHVGHWYLLRWMGREPVLRASNGTWLWTFRAKLARRLGNGFERAFTVFHKKKLYIYTFTCEILHVIFKHSYNFG